MCFFKIFFKPYSSVNDTIACVGFEAGPLQSHCLWTACCSPLSGCLTLIQLIHNIRWSRNWSSDVLLLLLKGVGSLTETIDTDLPSTFKVEKSWTLVAHWEFLPAPLHLWKGWWRYFGSCWSTDRLRHTLLRKRISTVHMTFLRLFKDLVKGSLEFCRYARCFTTLNNTYLHSLSLVCFLSSSVLFPDICLFHISECSLFVKALLDLLCKRITPMNCCYYFRIDLLDLPRGFVDRCVKTALPCAHSRLKGRHRLPWALSRAPLQSSIACTESPQQWEMNGVGRAVHPLERCVGRTGSFKACPWEVRAIQTACTHFGGWVLLELHPQVPDGASHWHS